MKIKLWAVIVIASLFFYLGNITSSLGDKELQLVVPETPNYTVKQGDTLYKIAQKVPVQDGMDVNDTIHILIKTNEQRGYSLNSRIYPGQEIYIPIKETKEREK